jgi:hypothetical protein
MSVLVRILAVLILLVIAAFCAFGFMATFEPNGFLALRSIYAASGVLCLLGAGWLVIAKRPKA